MPCVCRQQALWLTKSAAEAAPRAGLMIVLVGVQRLLETMSHFLGARECRNKGAWRTALTAIAVRFPLMGWPGRAATR